ncbi:MAG: DUF4286 family protein [Phycisphaerales bacterium]|nr:DUF4286 family protein [Phycisphaerales bacterium]
MPMLYEVNAEFIDPAIADAWAAWILDEHILDVIRAGARSGRLLRIDGDDDTPRFSVQYQFETREDLDRYLRDHSPRLRDEGLRRFPAEKVRYTRRIGEIVGAR